MNEGKTIGELLAKYPDGFSVGPGGVVNKTMMATSHFVAIARAYPVAPSNGGYLVVEGTDDGDHPPVDMEALFPPHTRVESPAFLDHSDES